MHRQQAQQAPGLKLRTLCCLQVYALLDQLKAERGGSILETESEGDSAKGLSHAEHSSVTGANEEQPSLETAVSEFPEAPVGSEAFSDDVAIGKGSGRRNSSTNRQRTPSLKFQKRD